MSTSKKTVASSPLEVKKRRTKVKQKKLMFKIGEISEGLKVVDWLNRLDFSVRNKLLDGIFCTWNHIIHRRTAPFEPDKYNMKDEEDIIMFSKQWFSGLRMNKRCNNPALGITNAIGSDWIRFKLIVDLQDDETNSSEILLYYPQVKQIYDGRDTNRLLIKKTPKKPVKKKAPKKIAKKTRKKAASNKKKRNPLIVIDLSASMKRSSRK